MKFLPLLLLFVAGHLTAQTSSQDFMLTTASGQLAGTLLYPASTDQVPLALIIAGSGPTDRDGNNPMMQNNSLKMLAEGLAAHGIASVRFDKRGVGASKAALQNERDIRFDHMIADVNGWVDTLAADPRFSGITVIGHSEGSTIGMIAAQDDAVERYISIAGPGTKAADKLKEQLTRQAPMIMDQALPIFEQLEKGELVEEVPPLLNALFRPSVQPYLISWFKYDPQAEIAKLDKPVLVVQGTTDLQVSLADAELLLKGNERAEALTIQEMNHVLKAATADAGENMATYADPDLPLQAGLVKGIVEFMRR